MSSPTGSAKRPTGWSSSSRRCHRAGMFRSTTATRTSREVSPGSNWWSSRRRRSPLKPIARLYSIRSLPENLRDCLQGRLCQPTPQHDMILWLPPSGIAGWSFTASRRFVKLGRLFVPFVGLHFDLLHGVLEASPLVRIHRYKLKAELPPSAPPD